MFDNMLSNLNQEETAGDRIRRLREEQGMTQLDLALKMGYSNKSSVAQIEASKNNISLKKVELVAKALGVNESYIMGWSNTGLINIPEDVEIDTADKETNIKRMMEYSKKLYDMCRDLAISDEEDEIIKAYRKSPENVQNAIKTLLGL